MDKIKELLTRRIAKVYPSEKELEEKLRKKEKIRIYQGFDPSKPDLHIGHLVGLLTLKQFQEMGHEVIFLIGDFTGMIGDPSGKTTARKTLTKKQVLENAKTYEEQAGLVLDFTGDNPIQLKFNSEWNEKLDFADVLGLAKQLTVQQLIERDMFQERLKNNREIYLNEFLYPLVQGYDSVAMEVDAEIGGTDQMFNMMIGRKLEKQILDKEKFVITTKLLVGSDGTKISKTGGNAINITNPADELYGQIMSLPDELVVPCFNLITTVSLNRVEEYQSLVDKDPMQAKKDLAFEIVKMLHSEDKAKKAKKEFEKVFQGNNLPSQMETFPIADLSANPLKLRDLLVEVGFTDSKSQAKRWIRNNAVEINQEKVQKRGKTEVKKGDIINVGKNRWIKLTE